MSIEERVNIIGTLLEKTRIEGSGESDNENTCTLSYSNDTQYAIMINVVSQTSVELYDENANYDDFHWRLEEIYETAKNTVVNTSETKVIGYGGSNNKQYDHRTWDTISYNSFIKVEPGEELNYTIKISEVSGGANNDDIGYRFVEIKFVAIGAYEAQ